MSQEQQHIDFDLVGKVLSAEATEKERAQLENWIAHSESNREEFESLKEIWELSAPVEMPDVNIDAAWKKVNAQTDEATVISIAEDKLQQRRSPRIYLAWAASIAVLLSIGLGVWFFNRDGAMLTAEAGPQGLELQLEDGSMVTLAPNATLEYPESLAEDKRLVALNGKGFFEVTSDKQRPFIVQTASAEVRVLGTRFEVNTAAGPEKLKVSVQEGRVQVTSEKSSEQTIVETMETCVVDNKSGELKKDELNEPGIFFWKDKTIRFKRTDLRKASEILSSLFHKEILIEVVKTDNCEITATFQDEEIDVIMEVIAQTLHLRLTKTNKGFKLQGEGC